MAKYILTLIELKDNAMETAMVGEPCYWTPTANTRYRVLDSAKESHTEAIGLTNSIITNPESIETLIISMGEWLSDKRDVRSVLADKNPAPEIPEDDFLLIDNHFRCELSSNADYQDIYWDTLRDVLFKHGYEPEWEE